MDIIDQMREAAQAAAAAPASESSSHAEQNLRDWQGQTAQAVVSSREDESCKNI